MNARTRIGMWIEAVVCLSPTAARVPFELFFLLHYVIITIKFDADIPPDSWWGPLAGVGGCFGIWAAFIMLRTQFGKTARSTSLWIARIGLMLGAATAAVLPEGLPPRNRFADLDCRSDVFLSLLPFLCFVHFAYLGRTYLFARSRSGRE